MAVTKKKIFVVREKEEIEAQIAEKQSADQDAETSLLRTQTKIAELAGLIEEEKQSLIELLNNRSSTSAQIQKFDTLMEQIQVRRSELHQRLITTKSEEDKQKELSATYEAELKEVSVIFLSDSKRDSSL